MIILFLSLAVMLLGGSLTVTLSRAEPAALIVTGLSPTEDDAARLLSLANETKQLLVARGFSESRVEVLESNVTREAVLKKLQAVTVSTNDEFWLVLYGVSGRSRGNEPAFQVRGPRLTAGDLKAALDGIPARQFIFIGTGNGGGFLPVLQGSRRTVLSATQSEGEPDQPRFSEAWLNAFQEDPKAPFVTLAARAAALVDAEYTENHLVQSEHSQLADPVTGTILDPPFGVNLGATNKTLDTMGPK